jgi:hypothetical protein
LACSSINTGAAEYSLTCAPVSAQALAKPFSALSTISSSPKALMKCFVRPVMTNLYGFLLVNFTVSPIMYRHNPQDVEITIA